MSNMDVAEIARRDARAGQIVQVTFDGELFGRTYGYRWGLRTVDPVVGGRVAVPASPRQQMRGQYEQVGTIAALGATPGYSGPHKTVTRRL